jgi:hypothetical protein
MLLPPPPLPPLPRLNPEEEEPPVCFSTEGVADEAVDEKEEDDEDVREMFWFSDRCEMNVSLEIFEDEEVSKPSYVGSNY